SANRSLSSRGRSPSQGVAAMTGGGLGAACAAGAAGFGAALAGSAGGFADGAVVSLPLGGAASEPPGFCSSAISVPQEDSYTYHLRTRVSNSARGAPPRRAA